MLTSHICCQQESLNPMCCHDSSVDFPISDYNKANFLLPGKGNHSKKIPVFQLWKYVLKIWPLVHQGEFCIPTINSIEAVTGCRAFPNDLSSSRPGFTFSSPLWVVNLGDRNTISKKARLQVQILFLRLSILFFMCFL